MKSRAGMIGLLIGPAVAVAAVDQAVKWIIVRQLLLGESHTVIPHLFSLTYRRNPDTAFSLLRDLPPQALLLITIVLLLAFLALVWPHLQRHTGRVAGILVLGGALGNMIDRGARGFVVDYLDVHVGTRFVWPTFNLADSCVVIGVIVLAWTVIRAERAARPAKEEEPAHDAGAA